MTLLSAVSVSILWVSGPLARWSCTIISRTAGDVATAMAAAVAAYTCVTSKNSSVQ